MGDEATGRVPWWVWFTGVLLFGLGVGIVCLGGVLDGLSDYLRSVFVDVGTAVGLTGPLFVGERLLSTRVREVRDQASAAETRAAAAQESYARTRQDLDELTTRVHQALDEVRADDRRRGDRFMESQAQEDLVELYERAAENGSIDRRGLRVSIDALDPFDWWLLVRVVRRSPEGDPVAWVELTFEDVALNPVGGTVVWSPGERADDVFVRLATELQEVHSWPGDELFRPGEILQSITDTLGRVIDIRTGRSGDANVRPIIQLVNSDWAITRQGLDSLRTPHAWAEQRELVGDSRHAWNRLEAQSERLGLDEQSFRQAFGTAEHVHQALDGKSPPDLGE
jgi:hypothetical protein